MNHGFRTPLANGVTAASNMGRLLQLLIVRKSKLYPRWDKLEGRPVEISE